MSTSTSSHSTRDRLKTVWHITRWEFNRFFKFWDLVKGFLFFAAFGLIGGGVGYWLGSETMATPNIALADIGPYQVEQFEATGLRFHDHTQASESELQSMLDEGEIDGILSIQSRNSALLQLPNDRGWSLQLEAFLSDLHLDLALLETGVDPDVYASISAGMELTIELDRPAETSILDKLIAGGFIGLVIIAVFMGFAYQFTAITAEKQQRIAELVVSAVRPQSWIDGKILGITGVGLAYVVFYGFMGVLLLGLMMYLGVPMYDSLKLINPMLLITFLMLALLGILMWNAFLAGIAALIDDPNTSQKSGFMTMPMLPVFFSFFAVFNPDTLAIKILGIVPITSYAVLPARMVLTRVEWWEPMLALLLLIATVWLFRILAGRLFAAGMLMYGKEPSSKEMLKLMRKSAS